MHQLKLCTRDIQMLAFPSSLGGGVYSSTTVVGTDDSILSTESLPMFHSWTSALAEAKRRFAVLP